MSHAGVNPIPGLFITGTDTGVGKTWVSAEIARALRRSGHTVGTLKPVATGIPIEGPLPLDSDPAVLREACGQNVPVELVCPMVYQAPLAPPAAARAQGGVAHFTALRHSTLKSIARWSDRAEFLVVEGVGGFLCPIAEGHTVADLAIELDYPLILVARRGLGTLNHSLLTLEAARRRGLRIAGIVLNEAEPGDLSSVTNADELSQWLLDEPLLAELGYNSDAAVLRTTFDRIEWHALARASRRAVAGS